MKIRSLEHWDDGTIIPWEVSVHEVPMDEETSHEWYDRDAVENAIQAAEGGLVRVFVVDEVTQPIVDMTRAESENEPIAAIELSGVEVGRKLVVIRFVGDETDTLVNIQDCGFDVEVVE